MYPADTKKSVHLLSALEEPDLVSLPADLDAYAFPKVRRGITDRLRDVGVSGTNTAVEVVCLQPTGTGQEGIISFETAAEYLASQDDPLALVLSDYLRRWTERAGERPPPAS